MPELPELVNYKNYADSTSLHKKITEVTVNNDTVLSDCTVDDLQDALEGNSFESTSRHGKYLFLHTKNEPILVMHFGMTGEPVYYKHEADQPEYARVVFSFDNGFHLAYNCPRMLGTITLTDSTESYIKKKDLGPDAYKDVNVDKFQDLFSKKRGMIKSALMDQSFIAGVGNECSDEILYQAKIHPKTKVQDLSQKQLEKLYKVMREVLETKIDADMKGEPLPEDYILRNREEGADCPKCDGKIKKITVSGRSGYYCPKCQSK